MHLRAILIAACLGACAAPDVELSETSSKLVLRTDGISDQYIVMLAGAPHALLPDGERAAVEATIDRLAAAHGATIKWRYASALRGFSARMTEDAARALADDPDVLLVEQNQMMHAIATQTMATWGLDRIDQRDLPLDTNYNFATDGAGTTAFVIDTGIRPTHLEFTGRVRRDLGGTTIDDGNGVVDCNGHGTHVSGTVGGSVFGVAKKTTLVPIRVLGCDGSGPNDGVVAGIDFVAGKKIARSVANMSLGGAASTATDTAIRNLVASGVTVVVAAGNENTDACDGSPAREPQAITVAATSKTDARANFSNFGTCVDLFAPGVDITSAWSDADNEINTISGTSMASPHVAGAAALFLAQNPNATPAQVAAGLLASTTANKVTDPSGSPNKLLFTTFTGGGGGGVMITTPADGAQVQPPFEIAVDAAGAQAVDIALDGQVVGTDTTAPFKFTVDTLEPGQHRLTASAGGARHEITVTVVAGSTGGVPLPVPVVPMRRDGCSAAGGQGGLGITLVLAILAIRRRRNRCDSSRRLSSTSHMADVAKRGSLMKTAFVLAISLLGLGACGSDAENFIGTYKTTLVLTGSASGTFQDAMAISEGETADLILNSQQLGTVKASIIGDTSFSLDQQQITLVSSTGPVTLTLMGQGTVNDGVLAASGQLAGINTAFSMQINGARQ